MKIAVLGPIQVTSAHGVPVEIPSTAQRRLVGALTLRADSVSSVNWLCDALGVELGALRTALSRLRKVIGSEAIFTRPSGYALDGVEVDARTFESAVARARATAEPSEAADALRAALSMWQGDAYEEFASEEWARSEATRLEQVRLGAQEMLAERLIDAERFSEAIATSREITATHPYHDGPRGLLMRALAASGRSTEALRSFREYRTLLGEEVGTVPSAALAAIEREIAIAAPDESDDTERVASSMERSQADVTADHLPSRLSSFVGRARETAHVLGLVRSERLVTITGTGGAGKTSLAGSVAARLSALQDFEEIWWLDLVPISDPRLVGPALATAVGARPGDDDNVEDALVRRFSDHRSLLLLDNCEHLLPAPAELALALVERCPNVSILATSRHPLGVVGESAWVLPPLRMDEGVDSEATQLFFDRAREVRPEIRFTEHERAEVLDICRILDGIPLAIELAAARMRVMSAGQIREALGDALRLLTRRTAARVERHQTLEASIQWSVDLLTPSQADLLAQMSVLTGSGDLRAVTALAGDAVHEMDVVDDLEALVDHALVVMREAPNGARFSQLETIRQFAASRLRRDDRHLAVAELHARHFAAASIELGPRAETADETEIVSRLDADEANIRAALSWLQHHDVLRFIETVAALGPYWTLAGTTPEGVDRVSQAIDSAAGDDPMVPRLHAIRAQMRGNLGDAVGAVSDCRVAIDRGNVVEDDWAVGRGLWRMSDYAAYGEIDRWRPISERAFESCERAEDRFASGYVQVWSAVPLLNRGHITRGQGPLAAAEHAVAELRNPTLAGSFAAWSAWCAYHRGDMETCWSIARPLYDGAGFRLPIQQVFVQRLLSGCALLQQETDPIADFPALVTAAQRKGEPLAAIMLADWDAHRRLYVDLDSAPSAAERSSDLARGLFPVASYASLVAAWVAWVHGDDEDLAAHLAAAEAPPASPPWPLHRAPLLQLQALLASVRGHREEATVRADEAVRLATEEGMAIERIRSLEVSSIVARDHRRSVARELLDEALAERGRLSLPRVFLPLVHALD